MKRNDWILLILLLCLSGLGIVFLGQRKKEEGTVVRISVAGKLYGEYSLQEKRELLVETAQGFNKIRIEANEVSVFAADCPDRYCAEHAAISKTTEQIVCLPHRMVIEIIREEQAKNRQEASEEQVDGISE